MSEINDEETPKEDDDVLKSKVKLMKVAVSLDQKPWKKPLDKNLIE